MIISGYQYRPIYQQSGLSWDMYIQPQSTSGIFNFCFSGNNNSRENIFSFISGKILSTDGLFLSSYSANDIIYLSGNINSLYYDIYKNKKPIALALPRKYSNQLISRLEFSGNNTILNLNSMNILGNNYPIYNYDANLNYNFDTQSGCLFNIYNNGSYDINIFSGVCLNNEYVLSGASGTISANTYKTFGLSKTSFTIPNFNLNIPIYLYTNFGDKIININNSGTSTLIKNFSINFSPPVTGITDSQRIRYGLSFFNDYGNINSIITLEYISGYTGFIYSSILTGIDISSQLVNFTGNISVDNNIYTVSGIATGVISGYDYSLNSYKYKSVTGVIQNDINPFPLTWLQNITGVALTTGSYYSTTTKYDVIVNQANSFGNGTGYAYLTGKVPIYYDNNGYSNTGGYFTGIYYFNSNPPNNIVCYQSGVITGYSIGILPFYLNLNGSGNGAAYADVYTGDDATYKRITWTTDTSPNCYLTGAFNNAQTFINACIFAPCEKNPFGDYFYDGYAINANTGYLLFKPFLNVQDYIGRYTNKDILKVSNYNCINTEQLNISYDPQDGTNRKWYQFTGISPIIPKLLPNVTGISGFSSRPTFDLYVNKTPLNNNPFGTTSAYGFWLSPDIFFGNSNSNGRLDIALVSSGVFSGLYDNYIGTTNDKKNNWVNQGFYYFRNISSAPYFTGLVVNYEVFAMNGVVNALNSFLQGLYDSGPYYDVYWMDRFKISGSIIPNSNNTGIKLTYLSDIPTQFPVNDSIGCILNFAPFKTGTTFIPNNNNLFINNTGVISYKSKYFTGGKLEYYYDNSINSINLSGNWNQVGNYNDIFTGKLSATGILTGNINLVKNINDIRTFTGVWELSTGSFGDIPTSLRDNNQLINNNNIYSGNFIVPNVYENLNDVYISYNNYGAIPSDSGVDIARLFITGINFNNISGISQYIYGIK